MEAFAMSEMMLYRKTMTTESSSVVKSVEDRRQLQSEKI